LDEHVVSKGQLLRPGFPFDQQQMAFTAGAAESSPLLLNGWLGDSKDKVAMAFLIESPRVKKVCEAPRAAARKLVSAFDALIPPG